MLLDESGQHSSRTCEIKPLNSIAAIKPNEFGTGIHKTYAKSSGRREEIVVVVMVISTGKHEGDIENRNNHALY